MTDYVRETYLEVVEAQDVSAAAAGDEIQEKWVVTLIKILSPWNKRARGGWERYVRKRNQVMHSATNLVEIDLLRTGTAMVQLAEIENDYSVFVSPFQLRPRANFYPFTVRDAIPLFQLPLQIDDDEPVVNLNQILHELYDRAGYDLRINYQLDPVPPFTDESAAWVEDLLRKNGYR